MFAQSDNYFLDWLKSALHLSSAFTQLFFFLGLAMLGCHFIACMFIFLARMEDFEPGSWTGRLGLDSSKPADLYLSGLQYIVTTLTTVGYGDIAPVTKAERMFCLVVMLFGVFMYSYTIGSLISIMASANERKNKLQKSLKALEELNKTITINKVLLGKVKRALRYESAKSTHHNQRLFSELPSNLSAELLLLLNQHLVQGLVFFHHRSPAFSARLIQSLRPLYVPKADRIYRVGDPNDHSECYSVFFLVKGRVALQQCMANGQFVTLVNVHEGNYFGELDLLFEAMRTELAWAEMDSELLSLERADFFEVCIDFPEAKDQILATAHSRLKLVRKLRRLAELVVQSSVHFNIRQTFTASRDFEDVDEDPGSPPSESQEPAVPDTTTDPGSKRTSFRKHYTVSRKMNSRSKVAFHSDAKLSNHRTAFEALAVIGELERKVNAMGERLDGWDERWKSIESTLDILLHERRLTRTKTMQPFSALSARRGALLDEDLEEEL